ncbi:MAG: DUF4860 domain-containing protein [Clostridia bacterium]|nr:DUF4860 domain-containing protein [Clostridia bacterium]
MKRSDRSPLGLYTIAIAALFLAGFFVLVLFGALTYRNTVEIRSRNYGTRGLSSYISTSIKGNDTKDGVSVEDSEHGQVLVLTQKGSGGAEYAVRIYRYGGSLVEDFAKAGAPLSPENAQIIGGCEIFTVKKISESLLEITTDAGSVTVNLRSGGDGQ